MGRGMRVIILVVALAVAVGFRPARANGFPTEGLVIGAGVSAALTAVLVVAILVEGSREDDPFLRIAASPRDQREPPEVGFGLACLPAARGNALPLACW